MAILVLKMSGSHDIVSEKENFKDTLQPRGNPDALMASASVAQKRLIVDVVVFSKDSLGLSDTSKMVIVHSTLPPK